MSPTVAEIAKTRKTATVHFSREVELIYRDDAGAAFKAHNERGSFEILLARDTLHLADQIMTLTAAQLIGFFRRRSSGWLADGTRHYIWTFCPVGITANSDPLLRNAA